MSKRTPENETKHGEMVLKLVNYLEKENYSEVKADHTGGEYDTPEKISWEDGGSHIPDVTAEKIGKMCVFEVETRDSICDDHTEDQWELFDAYAEHVIGKFIVVVPGECKKEARERIAELGISAGVWTIG